MNTFIKHMLLSFVLMQSGIAVCNAQTAADESQAVVCQAVVEDAEYKRAAEQLKKANAKVKELQDKLAIVEQALNSVQIEVRPLIRYGGPQSQRCIELWEQESGLKKEKYALLQEIKHAELMAELTTKFFDREVLRIESAEVVTTSPADDQPLSAEDVVIIAHIFKQLDYIAVVREQTQALVEVSLEALKIIDELKKKV